MKSLPSGTLPWSLLLLCCLHLGLGRAELPITSNLPIYEVEFDDELYDHSDDEQKVIMTDKSGQPPLPPMLDFA